MKEKKPLNKTIMMVGETVKIVSKDVRAPKCVRERKVKPVYLQQTEKPKVLSMALGKINFKEKEVLNYPSFSFKMDTSAIYGEHLVYMGYVSKSPIYDTIEMQLKIKTIKTQKLHKLFSEGVKSLSPKHLDLIIETTAFKLLAKGIISELGSYSDGRVMIGFKPYTFENLGKS